MPQRNREELLQELRQVTRERDELRQRVDKAFFLVELQRRIIKLLQPSPNSLGGKGRSFHGPFSLRTEQLTQN